jgi:hypothetical protein
MASGLPQLPDALLLHIVGEFLEGADTVHVLSCSRALRVHLLDVSVWKWLLQRELMRLPPQLAGADGSPQVRPVASDEALASLPPLGLAPGQEQAPAGAAAEPVGTQEWRSAFVNRSIARGALERLRKGPKFVLQGHFGEPRTACAAGSWRA